MLDLNKSVMKWHKKIINVDGLVVGNGKPTSKLSKFLRTKKINKPQPSTSKLTNIYKSKRFRILAFFIVFIIAATGIYYFFIYDRTNSDGKPVPGQPVGPPPTPIKLDDSRPRNNVQILPDGDGPTPPNGPSKPATGG